MRIWQRTVDYETPLWFTIFLSDGDSKAYNRVFDAVYPDAPIEKEECTNRMVKRAGTGLQKLPMPLPRGEKLKQTTIQKLENLRGHCEQSGKCPQEVHCHMGLIFALLLNSRSTATSSVVQAQTLGASTDVPRHRASLHRATHPSWPRPRVWLSSLSTSVSQMRSCLPDASTARHSTVKYGCCVQRRGLLPLLLLKQPQPWQSCGTTGATRALRRCSKSLGCCLPRPWLPSATSETACACTR